MQGWGRNWGFRKIRGTISGVPIARIMVFWGLYWGPPILRLPNCSLVVWERMGDGWGWVMGCAGFKDLEV